MRRQSSRSEGIFKAGDANNQATRYAPLRNKLRRKEPHGDACSVLFAETAYNLPSTSVSAVIGQECRVLLGGRVAIRKHTRNMTPSHINRCPDLNEQLRTPTNRQHHPNVMGGGVRCEGGTPHTPARRNGRFSLSTRRTAVRLLLCEGCEGSNPNYRVVRERAPAPARLSVNRVWTPHTPHTLNRRVLNGAFSLSIADFSLNKCEGGQTPPPITRQRSYTAKGGEQSV